jgi:glycosyltransferase involved in cell wall biosynthesis
MRVLIVHADYQSGPASGENQVVNDETRLLTEAGHEVRRLGRPPMSAGVHGVIQSGGDAVWSRSSLRELDREIRDARPDIIHCHNILTGISPAIFRAATRASLPIVMSLHNYRLMCLPGTFLRDGRLCEACLGRSPMPGVRWACYKGSFVASGVLATSISLHRTIGSFDKVTLFSAVSRFLREKHIEGGLDARRVVVKPNFAWPAARRARSDYYLFLGRLAVEKGVRTLIEAWRDVDAKLVVAGEGEEANDLRASAPSNVEFLGTIDHDRALTLIGGARALVIPSLWYEGAPRTILEAYAAGVPVLGSRIGAIPELVEEGRSGLLLTPGDPRAWVEGIRAVESESEIARLGEGAYELWERNYRPDAALDALLQLYRRASEMTGAGE